MTAQELKNSILQYAVQGKLVPQDSKDEPASVLFERINAEKRKLIKEKKIKSEKPLPHISEDEIPFEIPQNWEWVTMKSVLNIYTGNSISEYEKQKKYNHLTNGRNYIATKDVQFDNSINYVNGIKIPFEDRYFRIGYKDSTLMCVEGGSAGRKIGYLNEDVNFGNKLCCFQPILLNPKLIFYYLQNPLFLDVFKTNMNGIIGGVSINKIKDLPIPLPPLAEQQRIVAKIEELMPLVEEYDKLEKELTELNERFLEQIKKSVLQHAIQGKLVPQSDLDELASELLKRIKAKKQQLIKEKKIKAEKPFTPITDEEIPFEIPESWEWVRLGEIGTYRKGPFGSSLTKSMFVPQSENSVKVYEQKNAINKNHLLGDYNIKREYFETKMKSFEVFPDDIIVSCAGTIGETYIIPNEAEQGIINQALMKMKITREINIDYFLMYFDYILKKSAQTASNGSAIKNIPPFEIFKNLLIPLPPLSEQQRIVEKVTEVISICEKLR